MRVRIALVEAARLAGGVGFKPIFGVCGLSGATACRSRLRTVAKKTVALFACGVGDCASLIRHQQSSCANASGGVARCTNGACNNSSSLSNSAIPSRISIGIRSGGVNTMARHRQRVAPGLQTRDDCCACCLRLPVGTVLNRCRRATRRPIWRAVRGGLRAHRSWHYFVPVCSHASPATPQRGGAVKHSHGSRRHERIRHLLLVHRC